MMYLNSKLNFNHRGRSEDIKFKDSISFSVNSVFLAVKKFKIKQKKVGIILARRLV